jgi:hypothetical protein
VNVGQRTKVVDDGEAKAANVDTRSWAVCRWAGGLQGWVVDGDFVRDDGFLGRAGRTDGFVEKARV